MGSRGGACTPDYPRRTLLSTSWWGLRSASGGGPTPWRTSATGAFRESRFFQKILGRRYGLNWRSISLSSSRGSPNLPSPSSFAPMSPQVPPPLPALDNTFGAVLLGTFFGIILYGMTLHQSYRYYRLYPKDKLWLKGVVSLTILMETIHTFLACHVCYYYLVSNYFKPTALLFGSWSIKLLLICSGGVIIVAQSFFAWRVFLVGPQYRLLVFAAMSLLVGELAFFAAATIETFMIPTFSGFEHLTWLISTGSAMAITADLLLTTVLIVTLHRSRTGIKRTDSIIDVLILYALSTGLLTSIFNILSFLFTVLYIDNLIYVAFALVVTKLYANTLLVALNTRSTLTGNGGIIEASDVGVYGMSVVFGEPTTQRVTLPRAPSPSRGPESSVLELKVTTSSFVVDDSGQRLA